MTAANAATSASHRPAAWIAAALLALAALVGAPVLDPAATAASAAGGNPTAVIVVGPMADATTEYIVEARKVAAQLRSYGATVREVYSPNATWSRVTEASRGANLFVYLGAGRGHPGPYGEFNTRTMDGLGLNAARAAGHRNLRLYGEYYVRRSLHLAPGAVVILNHVAYAAGSSEPGHALPTRTTAAARADNYAAGFLGAGAAVVFAGDRSVTSIIRDLFGASRSMRSIFWRSPWTSTTYDSTFGSTRTPGSTGILAPNGPGRYHQSIVGRLQSTTTDWRRTWDLPVRVTSIPALLTALADDAVTEIVVADGTYRVSGAANKQANSLWIGARFAGRTRPVLVRAETTGGVTFDGGGGYLGGISFEEGAHHQTWQGFRFTNGSPMESGVIMFGGYAGLAAPHHITLRDITIDRSVTSAELHGHAVYFSWAVGGPHDLLLDRLTVDNSLGGLTSALHFYHSDAANRNAWNVTIRRLQVTGTQQAIMLWDPTLRDIRVDTAEIADALTYAVRYESPGASGITFANITSTGSGSGRGFYSSLGSSPPGVTFIDNSFR